MLKGTLSINGWRLVREYTQILIIPRPGNCLVFLLFGNVLLKRL